MKDRVVRLLCALLAVGLLLSQAALMEEAADYSPEAAMEAVSDAVDAVAEEETNAELVTEAADISEATVVPADAGQAGETIPDAAATMLFEAASAPESVGEAPCVPESTVTAEAAATESAGTEAAEVLSVAKKATKKVYLGTSYRIEVPDKTVKSFTSKNKKVAKVDKDGLVTPKKAGKAKIIVKLSKKKKFAVTLKVIDPTVPTKVTIGEGKKGGLSIGTPFQLTAVVEPATASQTVKWKSSKKSVATVDANGIVTPKKKGIVKITAVAGKKKATFTAKVRNNGIIELSQYWGKSLSATVKKLEGFKKAKGSGGYVNYTDGSVRLTEYRKGKYKSGIGSIDVVKTPRYTLFGVSIGMERDAVKALLREYEGKGDYYEESEWLTYSMHYPDVSDWFTITFTDGKVSEMSLNCFTNN